MSKILCTGSAGFMGSWIADELSKQGNAVIGIDNLSGGFMRNTLDHLCFFLDLRDKYATEKLISQYRPEILYFLAANARECASFFQPRDVTENNLLAYINTLEPCIKYGLKKVVLFSCHDKNTNLVTTKGIKKYTEITKDDLVYTLNQKTHDIEIKPINEIIVNQYTGTMLQFSGRANFCVTPNHRIFFIKSPHINPRLEFELAEKTFRRSYIKLPIADWTGIDFGENYQLEDRIDSRMKDQPLTIDTKNLFYLIGLYVADGSIRKPHQKLTKTGLSHSDFVIKSKINSDNSRFSKLAIIEKQNLYRTYEYRSIRFSVPKLDKARMRLEGILNKNGFSYYSRDNDKNIEVSSYGLSKIFKECGYGAHNKHIPEWCLLASKQYLIELFRGLLDGDGNKEHSVLTTVSKRLVENVIELALKIKLTASFKRYEPRRKAYIRGRLINDGPCYRVSFGYTEPNMHKRGMKKIEYSGDVWCLNVDNGNFLIERDGKVCFSGNSMSRYGDQEPPFDESLPPKPIDIYASNKVAMEEITKQLAGAHGFDWTIIVPRNVFGERQSMQDRFRNFIAITINHILRNEDVIIYGDGQQIRSFSYIKNSLNCYIQCLEEKTNGQIINIGGMVPKTINEVAEMIILNFPEYKGKIAHLPDRYGEVKHAWSTYKKSVDLLGYKEDISLEQGIKNMCDWARVLGPQNWTKDSLDLINEKVPQTWR